MKNKSLNISGYIALFAIILALMLVALMLPTVFLIPLLFVAVCFNFRITMLSALFFGLISLALSYIAVGSFVPIAFMKQPLIPIVPRLLVGACAFFAHFSLNKIIKKEGKLKLFLPKIGAAVVGSLANTVFVILFMYLLLPNSFVYEKVSLDSFVPVMMGMGLLELIVNTIVLPPLSISVARALKRTKYSSMLSCYSSPVRR